MVSVSNGMPPDSDLTAASTVERIDLFGDGSFVAARPRDRAAAHAEAMKRGARCTECPMFGCGRGPVMGDVQKDVPLIAIGEAPGKYEVLAKRVFVHKSGKELDEALLEGGLSRQQISIVNVLGCRPPPKLALRAYLEQLARQGKPDPIERCMPRLLADLAASAPARAPTPPRALTPPVILAVGGYALKAVVEHFGLHYGKTKAPPGAVKVATIMKQHGAPIDLRDRGGPIIVPSLHPAFAMRKHEYKHVVRGDIARAARIAVEGGPRWTEPPFLIFPDIETIERAADWIVAMSDKDHRVAVDIETDSADSQTCRIRCVGFHLQTDTPSPLTGDRELVVVVPFLWKDGRPYWSDPARVRRAKAAVRRVCDHAHLVGHNVMGFDIPVLHRHGMISDRHRIVADTMLGFRATYQGDLPKDLGAVVKRYFDCPLWKFDADHKAGEDVEDDRTYHVYNGRDVLGTGRVWPKVRQDILASCTQAQFRIDSTLAPIYADMGDLGVVIDEVERSRLSRELNVLQRVFLDRFQRLAHVSGGRPDINPGSWQQIAAWLYDDLGYTPALDPQGHEWTEGKNPSTSLPALLRLLDGGEVSDEAARALDALIVYRTCDKLRSTYVDDLDVRQVPELATAWRAPGVVVGEDEILPERNGLSLLHATFKLHVTPSGRTASSPNVQNWPSRAFAPFLLNDDLSIRTDAKGRPLRGPPTNLRRLIVAAPDHVLIAIDYKQIEQRLYALEAKDELLLEAYRGADRDGDPLDPHLLNAATLFCEVKNPSRERIMDTYHELKRLPKGKRKYVREVAKRIQYGEAYGIEAESSDGGPGTLFKTMHAERDKATGERAFPKITVEDAKRWHERWHRLHPWTRQWQSRVRSFVARNGYAAERVHGRRRYFPGGPSKRNAPPNMTIQGAAAAIKNEALLKLVDAIPYRSWSRWTGVVLEIHDQLVLQVPSGRAEEAARTMYDCMYFEIDGFPILPDRPATGWTLAGL